MIFVMIDLPLLESCSSRSMLKFGDFMGLLHPPPWGVGDFRALEDPLSLGGSQGLVGTLGVGSTLILPYGQGQSP